MNTPTKSPADKLLDFWNTKQGTGAMVVLALGGMLALYKAVPFLIGLFTGLVALAGKVVALGVLIAVIAVLGMVLTNKQFWLAITYWISNMVRWLTRAVIDSDPIGSAKTALSRMRKRLEEIRTHQKRIVTNLKRVEQTMSANNEERTTELELARQALQQKKQGQAEVHAATAAELQRSNQELQPVYKQMKVYASVFARVGDSAETKIQIFDRKIKIKERELDVKRSGQQAAQAARSAFKGADNDMLMESMDSVSEQIAAAEADMEQFLTEIMPTLNADELQRGVDAEKGMAELQKWLTAQDQKPVSLLESSDARGLLLEAGDTSALPNVQRDSLPVSQTGDFGQFFGSNSK